MREYIKEHFVKVLDFGAIIALIIIGVINPSTISTLILGIWALIGASLKHFR